MQKKTKKLTLNRLTVKALNDDTLGSIAGGCSPLTAEVCFSCAVPRLCETVQGS